MDVRWITGSQIEKRNVADIPALLGRQDGFLWVDIPACDEEAERLLSEVFRFHPHAIRDCLEKRHIPKIHTYADHVFVILHGIEFEAHGWGHMMELDQFVGERYLVTVHGPVNPIVPQEAVLREVNGTLGRMEAGRFSPKTPAELGHGVVSMLILRLEGLVSAVADEVADLEREIVRAEEGDRSWQEPRQFIERLYRLRHQLLTIGTTANLSREAFLGRASVARASASPERLALIHDLVEQYERLKSLCAGEKEFLDQVLDFYQARTVTKMNMAMQRLALIAALLLPVTALSGIYGMNVIVNGETDVPHVAAVLVVMGSFIALMLRWTKRQGWW